MQHYIYSIHVDDIVFPKFPTTYTEILHVFHELIRGLDNTRLQYHVNYLGISGTLRLQFREGRKIYLKGCFPYNYIHYILSNIILCSIFFFMQIFNFQGVMCRHIALAVPMATISCKIVGTKAAEKDSHHAHCPLPSKQCCSTAKCRC